MQNKPKVKIGKMNVSYYITKDYENKSNWTLGKRGKNKAKQSQSVVSLSILFQTQLTLCEFFLFFTFIGPGYNLAMQSWTIQKLLNWITEHFTKKGIDSPRLSAEILLSCVLAMKRIELYTQFDKAIDKQQLDRLHELVERAGRNEPVAYLTGKTEFYSLQLDVTPDCKNIEKHQLASRIKLLCGDLFDAFVPQLDIVKLVPDSDRGFDLIVCNPPYVSAAEFEKLDKNIKDYEPKLALFAGADGLDVHRRIIEKVDAFLKPDAALMLEIGFTQGHAIKEMLEQVGSFAEIKIEKDKNKNDRIATAKKTSS